MQITQLRLHPFQGGGAEEDCVVQAVLIGSANRTARKPPKPALPLTFPFPETMAKWPVMIDEFKFEVVSHGGRTGIQMRILKDQSPWRPKNRPIARPGAKNRRPV